MTGNDLRTSPYPLGAHRESNGIRFSFVSGSQQAGIIVCDKKSGRRLQKLSFSQENRIGDIYTKWVPQVDADSVSYQFYEGDRIVPDPCARVFVDSAPYGKVRDPEGMLAAFPAEDFDWEDDRRPEIPYEDCVCYLLHVRGFTKHSSSGVPHKGTFLGVAEKIPYLKELGITTVELQPAYEFLELEAGKDGAGPFDNPFVNPFDRAGQSAYGFPWSQEPREPKINYWGYRQGFYYAPKKGYAFADPVEEFSRMVREFHRQGMEVVMQFYFPGDFPVRQIPDILLYWVLEYHVDGFHVMGERVPTEMIIREPGLAGTKLWFSDFQPEPVRGNGTEKRFLAYYREEYMQDLRRFLKGDSDRLKAVIYHMRCNPSQAGRINFFTNYHGFTLMDLVSYDEKHNEANGENNRDGSDDNQSWNCGTEGPTKRKQVLSLRRKQYKNAMAMLFLSQGTPLLFMGDEFGNSQKGNNNPYCQDNEICWLNWNDQIRNSELFAFTADMIALRKAHPILHQREELKGMDYLSCGYPDLSYHGAAAWRPSLEYFDRQIGIMYCGKYAGKDGREDDFLYVALNMHWEAHDFALPRLPKDLEWDLLFMTEENPREAMREPVRPKEEEMTVERGLIRRLPPRTVAVYISRERA